MNPTGWVVLTATVATVVGLAGCRDEKPAPAQNPAASATAASVTTAAPVLSLPSRRVHWNPSLHRHPRCKAIATFGRVEVDVPGAASAGDAGSSTSVGVAGDVPQGRWVSLAESSKLTTKDPKSGRELNFEGKGMIRPCEGPDDDAWLSVGTFGSVPGAGDAPGAEQWVATPLGVVRYSASVVKIVARDASVEIKVLNGSALLWTSPGASAAVSDAGAGAGASPEAGWRRLDTGASATLTGAVAIDSAVKTCIDDFRATRALGEQVSQPDAALGELAPRHVLARQTSHAACAVAHLRAEALPKPTGATWLTALLEVSPPDKLPFPAPEP